MLLDNQNQDAVARARFDKFGGSTDRDREASQGGFAVVDITPAYSPTAARWRRGLRMLPGRRSVIVQDEMLLSESVEMCWGMTTKAQIEVDGNRATLRQDGQSCVVTILSPDKVGFQIESAEQSPPQYPNKGFKRLVMRLKVVAGSYRVAVHIGPLWNDGQQERVPELKPLSQWD